MEDLSSFLGETYTFDCDYSTFIPPFKAWMKESNHEDYFGDLLGYFETYVEYFLENIKNNASDDIVKAALNKNWSGRKLTISFSDYDTVKSNCVHKGGNVGLKLVDGNMDINIGSFGYNMSEVCSIKFEQLLIDDILSAGLSNVSFALVKNHTNNHPKILDAMNDIGSCLGETYTFECDYTQLLERVNAYLKESNNEDWYDSIFENVAEYVDYVKSNIKSVSSDDMVKEALVDTWKSKKLTMTYLSIDDIENDSMNISHNSGNVGLRLNNGDLDIVIGVWARNTSELCSVSIEKFL